MKYSTASYILKNFIFLALLTVVPSLFFSLTIQPDSTALGFFIKFSTNIEGFVITSFFKDVYSYFSFINFNKPLLWLAGVVVAVLTAGIVFCTTERHMRLGVKMSQGFLRLINDSFMSILPYVLLIFVIFEAVAFIISGLVFTASLLMTGLPLFVVSLILTSLIYCALLVFVVSTISTVPIMLSEGYSFRFALSYSISISPSRLFIMSVEIILINAVALVLTEVFAVLLNTALPTGFLLVMFELMFLPVFATRNYMTLSGQVRRDVKSNIGRRW